MDPRHGFFDDIIRWCGDYFSRLTRLPQLWSSQRPLFWSTLVPVAVVLVLAVLLLLLLRGKKRGPAPITAVSTTFVPVEGPGDSIEGAMLSPEDQIVGCTDTLDPVSRERLLREAPASLERIVRVYDRCTAPVQQELASLARSEQMMENYAARLPQGAAQGVLLDAWRQFPNESALRSFVEMLADTDEDTQRSAVKLLSALQEPKVLPMLVLALVRPDVFLPARVAEVFLSMPKESVSLLSYILPELEDRHKRAVLEIIAQAGVTFPAENVLNCMEHRDLRIRAEAMLALGSGHITEALPRLLAAAEDRAWEVRAVAAKALGLLGDKRALPVLEALTHDKEGWVAEAARQALAGFSES